MNAGVALEGLSFHHIGLATRSIAETAAVLAVLGYQVSEALYDPEQSVRLAFASHPAMPAIELIAPEPGVPGPVDNVLKSAATAIYHLGYECADIEAALAGLAAQGFRALRVSPAKPAVLFGGDRVLFCFLRDFGLIELIERPGGPG